MLMVGQNHDVSGGDLALTCSKLMGVTVHPVMAAMGKANTTIVIGFCVDPSALLRRLGRSIYSL